MSDAISLHLIRWRKKKVESFIIPPTYFRKNDYSIVEVTNNNSHKTVVTPHIVEVSNNTIPQTTAPFQEKELIIIPAKEELISDEPKFSALSLSSIRAKKNLEENLKGFVKEESHTQLPKEAFTETEMLLQWTKYAQRLGSKGFKIMESLLLLNDPKLEGTKITYELPNEGSKLDFEKEMIGLLGHLRGHLHNHDINIDVIVNESIDIRRSFTDQDRYNRLMEINPNLELLKTTFGLDISN